MFDIQYRLCSIYFTGLYCTVQYNFLFCLFYLYLSPNSFNLPRAILFMTCTVCNVRVLHLEYERFKDINWSNGALLYVYIMFSCWAEHIALQWKITYSLIYCMYRYVVCERGCQLSPNLLLMQCNQCVHGWSMWELIFLKCTLFAIVAIIMHLEKWVQNVLCTYAYSSFGYLENIKKFLSWINRSRIVFRSFVHSRLNLKLSPHMCPTIIRLSILDWWSSAWPRSLRVTTGSPLPSAPWPRRPCSSRTQISSSRWGRRCSLRRRRRDWIRWGENRESIQT